MIPQIDAPIESCRSILTVRAYDEAKRRGRAIEPINDQEIRVSTGRNIVTGRTACRAFVDGQRVDLVRDLGSGAVFRVVETA